MKAIIFIFIIAIILIACIYMFKYINILIKEEEKDLQELADRLTKEAEERKINKI